MRNYSLTYFKSLLIRLPIETKSLMMNRLSFKEF